jgi:hypothetical protein
MKAGLVPDVISIIHLSITSHLIDPILPEIIDSISPAIVVAVCRHVYFNFISHLMGVSFIPFCIHTLTLLLVNQAHTMLTDEEVSLCTFSRCPSNLDLME